MSISVTITDISTQFGTEQKYNTTNTPEWPNSHKLKIRDGGGRYVEFRKNDFQTFLVSMQIDSAAYVHTLSALFVEVLYY